MDAATERHHDLDEHDGGDGYERCNNNMEAMAMDAATQKQHPVDDMEAMAMKDATQKHRTLHH